MNCVTHVDMPGKKIYWIISLGLGYSATIGYTNQFTDYWTWPYTDLLIWSVYSVIFFTLSFWGLLFYLTWPRLDKYPRSYKVAGGITLLFIVGIVVFLFSDHIPLNPPFAKPYTLEIIATGKKNMQAAASEVWVEEIETGKGKVISPDSLRFVGDWSAEGGLPRSTHQTQLSILRWSGYLDSDLILTFGSHPGSGIAEINWNGQNQSLDLYNKQPDQRKRVRLSYNRFDQSLLVLLLLYGAYILSISALVFVVCVWLGIILSTVINKRRATNNR